MRPTAAGKFGFNPFGRTCLAVDSIGAHGLVGIDDMNNPRRQKDILSLQAIRVAAAVVVFVMLSNNGLDVPGKPDRLDDRDPDAG